MTDHDEDLIEAMALAMHNKWGITKMLGRELSKTALAVARPRRLMDALEAIAAPRECGCSVPCQCNTEASLRIIVETYQDIARAVLSPPITEERAQ